MLSPATIHISDTDTDGNAGRTAPVPTPVHVLVADDHPLFRQGIVRALTLSDRFHVVAEAGDGATALALIRRHEPDVAILDVRMPGMDGIDVIAALARYGPPVPVVLLSAFDDEPLVVAGLEAGAAAYITKSTDRDTILRQLADAAGARETRSPSAIHGAADLGRARTPGWTPRLTSREHRLLQLAHAGRDKPELARLCGIDEPTLRRQLSSALAKLGADDLSEALSIASPRASSAEPVLTSVAAARVIAAMALLPVEPVDPRRVEVGGDGYADGGEEAVAADRVVDAVLVQPVAHRVLELGERQLDAGGLELVVEVAERLAGGRVDVGDRFPATTIQFTSPERERAHALAEVVGVGEEERRVEPVEHEPGDAARFGIALDVVGALVIATDGHAAAARRMRSSGAVPLTVATSSEDLGQLPRSPRAPGHASRR